VHHGQNTLSLAGTWRFRPGAAGEDEAAAIRDDWAGVPTELPGSLQQQGIGDPPTIEGPWIGTFFDRRFFEAPEHANDREPGRLRLPFWLTPSVRFSGAAWYRRSFDVPAEWAGMRLAVVLERVHWRSTVWLDDRLLGTCDSLSVPHIHEVGENCVAGRHVLTMRIENGLLIDLGVNSHSISDNTQGDWNGVVGRIQIVATPRVRIGKLEVFPDATRRRASVRGRVDGADEGAHVAVHAFVDGECAGSNTVARTETGAGGEFLTELELVQAARTWSEFSPVLHRIVAEVEESGHRREVEFGLREITTDGRRMLMNGQPMFLRGALECCIFPRTGYPPTDVDAWLEIMAVVRAHGLNHLRFHSWCPPEAAFVAADRTGVYLQIEAGSWPNQSTVLGQGRPVDAWLEAESRRILDAYGNHPSFVLMAAGNEPGGGHSADTWLAGWTERRRQEDSRRLYTATACWPLLPTNQFHVTSDPRTHQWLAGLKSRLNALPPETRTDYGSYVDTRDVPVVTHEIGQWCAYPRLDDTGSYIGHLKPRNLELFREKLAANHMGDQASAFLAASGRLQVLCYKEEIESALRTPGLAGFQLLDLRDFPGQGTAPVGVLDVFWRSKGYLEAGEMRRFCGPIVPLVRLERRVFEAGDLLVAEVEIAHYGAEDFSDAVVRWKLVDDAGSAVREGVFGAVSLASGGLRRVDRILVDLDGVATPARLKLVVSIDGTAIENDWSVWVYPKGGDTPTGSRVMRAAGWNARVEDTLARGGTVVLTVPSLKLRGDARGQVQLGFTPIFWNTWCTAGQAPHTLGILCDPAHPAFASFPTDGHTDWQWWYVIRNAGAMILDRLPPSLRPIVQVVDDWNSARRLGLVFEARVGKGRVLVSSIDFRFATDPVCRQLQTSLESYATSPAFDPEVEVEPACLRTLFVDT
jgi:hypothetical protein